MARTSAVSVLFASVLVATQAAAGGAPLLTQQELSQPDAIVAWLGRYERIADKTLAKQAFNDGLQTKKRKDWGAAMKAFGESAVHYPAPRALMEYAEAYLRMLGDLKRRDNPSLEASRGHLATAASTYRAALASDSVLKQLTREEREQAGLNARCLTEYVGSSKSTGPCPPLDLYGTRI